MGRFDFLIGIDEEHSARRNVLVGSGYALATLGGIAAAATNTDEDADEGQTGDDEPEIAFEDDWFGPVTEEHNPDTFDPDEDLATVAAWIDEVVDLFEFMAIEMAPRDVAA